MWRKTLLAAALVATLCPTSVSARATCQSKIVYIYVTSWCSFCRQAEAFFRRHGVTYISVDVERSGDAFAAQIGRTYGVPYIVTEKGAVMGFNEGELRRALCITYY